jgi:2-polyprenyl-3-methyl-5-hydroxy-6-metoxy-1,4-benzoquinol methylase
MNLDSVKNWDLETQRKFWNEWDGKYLQDSTIGDQALRRGEAAVSLLKGCSLWRPNIMEFGCGNGWLAEKLAAYGPVTGVDIADKAITEARRRVPSGMFHAGDALSLDLPAETFEVVVTLEMFSHVPSQPRFVQLMARVLKKGGYLILATQNRTVYMRRKNIAPPAEGQLRRWVTMRELMNELRPHFEILRATTIQPAGELGFLRIINSTKLNRLVSKVIPKPSLERLKERCGLGQTLIVLARKRF